MNSMKKFLITGITGFAGPHLANLLYKEAIVSDDIPLNIKRRGVSVDPSKLPKEVEFAPAI